MENKGFTSDNTLKECQTLIDMCFEGNAILDNIVYKMNIMPINMPNVYEFVHQTLSHALPIKFADAITDFLLIRGDVVYRGAIPIHNKIYNNLVECLEDVKEVFINIQKQIEIIIDIAIVNKDKAVEDFLRSLNVDTASIYVKQAIVLLEGAKAYASSGILPSFNKDFNSYVILSK